MLVAAHGANLKVKISKLSKTESHIFLIVTCGIGIIKICSSRTWRGSEGWWGVGRVRVLKERWDAPWCQLIPEANLTLQLLLFRPI